MPRMPTPSMGPATAIALLLSIALAGPVHAQRDSVGGVTLVVGTKVTEPFVSRAPDGGWTGLSIELWERILAEHGWTCRYREMELEHLLRAVGEDSLAAGVAAVTVTAERERSLDFSHPFYSTGLGIAVGAQDRSGWLRVTRGLASRAFLQAVVGLVLLLLVVGIVVWLFERRRNPQQFGGTKLQGIGSGFWWSAVTMTTVGYGDKAPVTMAGRLVALVWMFSAIIVISSITAALTSALTVNRLESRIRGPEDLPRVRVGTLGGTAAQAELLAGGIRAEEVASLTAGLEALLRGDLDAVVYDEPILRYRVRTDFAGDVQILPRVFGRQVYAFAFPQASPLREPVNRTLLEILQGAEWRDLVTRYLGSP